MTEMKPRDGMNGEKPSRGRLRKRLSGALVRTRHTAWAAASGVWALVALFAGVLSAGPLTLRFDNVVYHVLQDRTRLNKFAPTYAKVLHAVFMEEAGRVYAAHSRVQPGLYRIVLADSATALQRETGLSWFTAGLYDPDRDMFFFQNPMRLQERGILRQTIAHELCHHVVRHARTDKVLNPRGREVWLEESYCEGRTASGNACGRVSSEVSRIVREAGSAADLRKVIENKSDRAAALRGLCLARLWGRHLATRYGERTVFRWMTTDRQAEIQALPGRIDTAFTEFRAKFR